MLHKKCFFQKTAQFISTRAGKGLVSGTDGQKSVGRAGKGRDLGTDGQKSVGRAGKGLVSGTDGL